MCVRVSALRMCVHVCVVCVCVCVWRGGSKPSCFDTMEQSVTNINNHTWPGLFTMGQVVQGNITCSISDDL